MNSIPFAEDMEKAVIVSALADPLLLPKISAIVESDDFYKNHHKEIWKTITSLEADTIDSLSVSDKLSKDTQVYFKELVEDSERILPAISNALFYAETVKHKAKLRAGIELGQKIIATCYQETDADEAISQLEDMFAQFLQQRVIEDKSESTQEAFKRFLDSLRERVPDDPNVIKTGFTELDLTLQRLEGLVVLAARPSMGKTALALNIAANVLEQGHPVLMFSLEQTKDQVFERLLSAESGLPLEEIRLGIADENHLARASKQLDQLLQSFHIDDRADIPTSYITSVARQKKFEWGTIGLIVVDYLHIVKLNDKNRVDALGDATKELRALGKELGCPVLLLSQLRRDQEGYETRKKRRPELTDLRSSGEIEQSADIVIFIHRESYYDEAGLSPDEDIAEVIVRKNRNGRTGQVLLEWLPGIVKFKDARR